MFLAVDIGNTDIVCGIYKDRGWTAYRVALAKGQSSEEYKERIANEVGKSTLASVNQVLVSSVVPHATGLVGSAIQGLCDTPAITIGPNLYGALPIAVSNPTEIGTDLVANAVAAHVKFKCDCMVIDFGTALTFTVIEDKQIKGVNIIPGLKTSMSALIDSAAQLEQIPLELPPSVIGRDTTSAIQAGILWGYVGLVERMIDRINGAMGHDLKVVATGGLSEVLKPLEPSFDEIDRNLTLEGIRLIGEYN